MKRLPTILCCLVLLLAAMRPATARAALVYDNLSGTYYGPFDPGSLVVGDEVNLDGGPGILSEFTFLYSATAPGASASVTLTLYNNDGTLVPGHGLSPGTPLWTSTAFGISATPSQNTFRQVIYDTTDFGSSLVVHQHFTWAVQFNNLGAGSVALADISAPSIGSNYDTYWQNNGSGWTLNQVPGTPISFGATISAIPEPSAIWVPAFSALTVIIARRIIRQRWAPVSVLDAN